MINILFLICCANAHFKKATVGFVDSIDNKVCTLQLENGEIEILNSNICLYFKEGDKIKIERKNE